MPAFGSWDWNDNLPFTQCFESARQAGLLRYGYSESEDRDLYVTGDLYENDFVKPAVIVVPRRRVCSTFLIFYDSIFFFSSSGMFYMQLLLFLCFYMPLNQLK